MKSKLLNNKRKHGQQSGLIVVQIDKTKRNTVFGI